jgi:hypothetical protein
MTKSLAVLYVEAKFLQVSLPTDVPIEHSSDASHADD